MLEESAIDGGFSDGAGSHLVHGLYNPGQFCDDALTVNGGALVCGKLTQQSHDYALCMECGTDTLVGCACSADSDCQGIEDGLRCWGGDESGWPGDAGGGKCLPAADSEDGREALEEMPWFCLDSCAAMGQFQDWSDPGCVFQGSVDLTHGTCVDLSGGTGACMPGECEEQNLVCGASGCTTECTVNADCPGLGFPDLYVCDDGGHCVPPECANAGIDFAYCNLYR